MHASKKINRRSQPTTCLFPAPTSTICDKKGAHVVHPAAWSMNSLPKSPSPICSHACYSHSHSHTTNYSQYAPQFSTPRNQVESFENNNNCSTCFSDIDEWLEHANNFCIPSNFQTNHLTGTVDSRRNGSAEEDLRISAGCNTFLLVPEDELHNITLPSVREESPVFQGQTRLTCIYGASKFGSNERRRLIRLKPHDQFLDEVRWKKQEAKRDARKKTKHAELMHRMRRKEDAIDDWELQQTRKAKDEMDKLQNELERKQLMASARTQQKICMVREKAEKQKLHLRLSTMKRFQKLQI